MTTDSLEPIPYVLVKNKSRNSASYSNFQGFFTLVVGRGDIIEFSSIGYKRSELTIPQSIQKDKFYASWTMLPDTMQLQKVTIVPWKNIEELKSAFVSLKLSESEKAIAYQNLQYESWAALREKISYDADEHQLLMLQNQNQQALFNAGIGPSNNIANPFAWASFIDWLGKNKKKNKREEDLKYKYDKQP